MSVSATPLEIPGLESVQKKGWLLAHKWLLLRRFSQISILSLFLLGPVLGIWIVKGNMSSSLTLDVLSLTDPFVFVQSLLSGHMVETTAIVGGLIVFGFYALVGGRVYCSWVCPINIVTDIADWFYRKLKIKSPAHFSKNNRYALLAAILVVTVVSEIMVWELINPVTMLQRELVFTMGFSWLLILAIFIVDAFISRRAWCGRFCPMGAFYGLLGQFSLIRVNALNREACNDCMDCYVVCPEPQVIKPVLKKGDELNPVILAGNCTNCGRCIDVCSEDVFSLGIRSEKFTDIAKK
jgi:ferredoxin-type protein NapH